MRQTGHAKYRNRGVGKWSAHKPLYPEHQARWDAVLAPLQSVTSSPDTGNVPPVPSDLAIALADEVNRLRAERGLSVNALAVAAGLPQSTLSRRLQHHAALDADDVEAIARVFEMTPAQLMEYAQRG